MSITSILLSEPEPHLCAKLRWTMQIHHLQSY